MSDTMFYACIFIICTLALGIPTSILVLYTDADYANIPIGYFAGFVLGLAINTGVSGMSRIHESQEVEKEGYAQKRVEEAKKEWEQNKP
jgi:hypothetical protein